jgi:hypothetical protein
MTVSEAVKKAVVTLFGVIFLLFPVSGHSLSWQNVPIGAGGLVNNITADPNAANVFYIGTDVGGAYRWDPVASRWIPITDTVGLNHQSNDFGVEAIVVDPSVAGTVWLYAGTWPWGEDGVYKSTDSGATWTLRPIPGGLVADAGGQTSFKARGPRLAVDPNNSNIVYLASINLGLQKTTNGGSTWTRVTAVPGGETGQGLSFVAFDKGSGTIGGATAVIYVGVFDRATANGGVWKSTDAGVTWAQMTGTALRGPFRGAVSAGGYFYVTFWKYNAAINGGVFVAARTDTGLTNITPPDTTGIGYTGLAVDPTPGSGSVYVVQSDDVGTYRLHLWRTFDGGTTWSLANSIIDSDNHVTRPTGDGFLLLVAVAVNPANPAEVWGSDGTGVFRTPNIVNTAQHWTFLYRGAEETFPYNTISTPAPGAPLLSGYLDFPGARHMNVTQYPSSGFTLSSTPASYGDGPSLDFCESNPNIMARVVHSWGFGAIGYVSSDNGATWWAMGGAPPVNGGRIAVSGGNCQNFVWLPETGNVYYSLDGGNTWTAAVGAPTVPVGTVAIQFNPLAADRVQANTFYLVDVDAAGNARVWRSTNGGANWAIAGTIPPAVGAPYNYRIVADPGVAGKLWIDFNIGQGLWKSANGGVTFTRVGQLVGPGGNVAFGKPAPGRTNASVLFYGSLDGVAPRGVYVSPDDGATWQAFPAFAIPDVFDGPASFGGDRQTYGRVYIGTSGRGLFVGDMTP